MNIGQYLIKYIDAQGRSRPVDPNTDVAEFRGILLGGVLFDESNIVTVSGVNSMSSVSGALEDMIMSVSGSSDDRDDLLQDQIDAIVNDQPKEQTFVVSGPSQRVFGPTTFAFNPSNAIPDIKVYRNGIKMEPSPTGVSSVGDFHKVDGNTIEFHYDVMQPSKVTIRDERTGGGGGGGGGVDLESITVDPKPATNGGFSLGSETAAWDAVYLKDSSDNTVYRLEVVSGFLQAASV